MNTFEELLSADLHAETEHIEVSEQDLSHAQHRYERHRDEALRRHRARTTLTAAAAVLAVLGGGAVLAQQLVPSASLEAAAPPPTPSTETPGLAPLPLTQENLHGVWLMQGGGWLWVYRPDGTLSIFHPQDPPSPGHEEGPYAIIPGGLDQSDCPWDAEILPHGQMRIRARGGTACESTPGLTEESGWLVLTRLSPAPPRSVVLSWSTEPPGRDPSRVVLTEQLVGAWIRQGTGQLLMVRPGDDGVVTYALDDDGGIVPTPDDTGTVVLTPEGLTLTSSAGSSECTAGASVLLSAPLQWRSALDDVASEEAMKLETLTDPVCGAHDQLQGTWIRTS